MLLNYGGGQGADEVISEAEGYAVEQQFQKWIIMEDHR